MSAVVTVIGRLGQDPEARYTDSGAKVVNFSVASDEGKKNEKKPRWYKMTAFDKVGEMVERYFKKGGLGSFTGNLTVDEYKDKTTGDNKFSLKVTLSLFNFIPTGKSEKSEAQQSDSNYSSPPQAAPTSQSPHPVSVGDDDIPF